MVLGAAWSGRLPVTQYKQVGSNPIETAIVGERKTQMVLSSNGRMTRCLREGCGFESRQDRSGI